MSDSVRPHRRQPTRLPCPWDSPGKNTGVDCHFHLPCMKVKSESQVAQSCPTLHDPMKPTRLLGPWDLPGKSSGMGCHHLLRSPRAGVSKLQPGTRSIPLSIFVNTVLTKHRHTNSMYKFSMELSMTCKA